MKYDLDSYRRFNENLRLLLNGLNILHPTMRQLKKAALRTGTKTRYGSYGWRSSVSSRIAPKTVYLGKEAVQLPNPTAVQQNLIENAPEQLHKVLQLMASLPMIHVRRQMGNNPEFNPICNLYMSVADPKNYRIAYMWANTMRKPGHKPGPEFIMIHIPEEHQLKQQVLVLPEHNLNIALGTDYMGEDKKGFLRQAMWFADEHNMLGLHAGSKLVYARDVQTNQLKKYGVFLFGLTATGKSTWSCHQLGLDPRQGEHTQVTQDDIVFLRRDGSSFGSENGFFVKTDVDRTLQEAMYYALIDKSALYENVMINSQGYPDFLDEKLCANGRAVIQKNRLRIKQGRRLVSIAADSINTPPLEELDGIIFAFITRRNTIMPFAQELTPEQAVLAYLWGESTHSYASQPLKAGESVRIVGTDPFIVGSRGQKVNRFYQIIMELVEKYPGKVRLFQYNTGGMGEILEAYQTAEGTKKRVIRSVERVPIHLMAAIQRGDLRGSNRYEIGRLGTREIVACEGFDLSRYRTERYYSAAEIDAYIQELVDGRREFTQEIISEGLFPEINKAAEKSFEIAPHGKKTISIPDYALSTEGAETVEAGLAGDLPWALKTRPKRGGLRI